MIPLLILLGFMTPRLTPKRVGGLTVPSYPPSECHTVDGSDAEVIWEDSGASTYTVYSYAIYGCKADGECQLVCFVPGWVRDKVKP